MHYPNKKFISEMTQLIKSLMVFCDYEIIINKNEINISCAQENLANILLFLKPGYLALVWLWGCVLVLCLKIKNKP